METNIYNGVFENKEGLKAYAVLTTFEKGLFPNRRDPLKPKLPRHLSEMDVPVFEDNIIIFADSYETAEYLLKLNKVNYLGLFLIDEAVQVNEFVFPRKRFLGTEAHFNN